MLIDLLFYSSFLFVDILVHIKEYSNSHKEYSNSRIQYMVLRKRMCVANCNNIVITLKNVPIQLKNNVKRTFNLFISQNHMPNILPIQ